MSEELNLADANLHALHAERAALRLAAQTAGIVVWLDGDTYHASLNDAEATGATLGAAIVALCARVAQYANSVIAQCRVAGAVLAELSAHQLAWCEVAPAAAKRALTGRGDAKKRHMLESAAHRFGHDALFLEFAERRGVWAAWMNDRLIYDEHAADALGLALSVTGKVEVVEG